MLQSLCPFRGTSATPAVGIEGCKQRGYWPPQMKTTRYFDATRVRPDRAGIKDEWIQRVIDHPEYQNIQVDGRIRRWGRIAEVDNKYLRVVLLPDQETVHNAFFDRGFKP